MTQASRFLFDNDFRRPGAAGSRAVAEAEERGRAAGIAAGLAQAQTSLPARLAQAAERLAGEAGALLADAEARHARIEEEAVALALAFAQKIAGEALDADPLGLIADAARAALQHLRGVPHLAVRVNDALVEEVDAMLKRLAASAASRAASWCSASPTSRSATPALNGPTAASSASDAGSRSRAAAPRRKPKPQPDQIGTAMAHDNDLQLPRLEEADPLALGTLDAPVSAKSAADLEQVFDVPVTVSAVLGNARMPVGDLLKLAPGAVLELDRKVGEAIDIFVNNRLVARGEVVLVDERLGVTMTEIIKGDH